MFKQLQKSRGAIATIFLLVLISALMPIYFMADDWEHLNWYVQDYPPFNLLREVFRVPTWVALHYLIFPIFAEGHFFLAKLLTWGSLLLATHYGLKTFSIDYKENFSKSHLFGIFLLFCSFPINMYEWSFWPTNMTVMPALLILILGFNYHLKNKGSLFAFFIKVLTYLFAFFSYESLLLMAVLIEVAHATYFGEKKNIFQIILEGIKRTLPFFVVAMIIKYVLDLYQPFPYPAEVGFKPHLFYQWLSVSFSHDYYKVRHATGALFTISIVLMMINRIRRSTKEIIQKDLFIIFMYFLSSSYYFVIMNYSARRALGGQVYFFWCLLSLLALWNFRSNSSWKSLGRISMVLFFTTSLIHQGYVVSMKVKEHLNIQENVKALAKIPGSTSTPVRIKQDFPRKNLNQRAWNFVNTRQLNGFIRYYLPKEKWNDIDFKWDGFEKGPYKNIPPRKE